MNSAASEKRIIAPGSVLGVMGGGQLGRMFAISARQMGYGVHVFCPDESPAADIADKHESADYEDSDALKRFAAGVDVVTVEFENIPPAAVEQLAELVPTRPNAHALSIAQHRSREKTFLKDAGLPVTPFAKVTSADELAEQLQSWGAGSSGVAKTAASGYDGKGQCKIESPEQAGAVWSELNTDEAVLEKFIDLQLEVSVIVVRSCTGEVQTFGPIENSHADHILDISRFPARVSQSVSRDAVAIAREVAGKLRYEGVLCVEFFVTRDDRLMINEIAPRPHNSGHLTIEACIASQFEQQVRAITGLPLGEMEVRAPAAMANLLGDLWFRSDDPADDTITEPNWAAALAIPDVHLHLYGKSDARRRRKMGHLTALAETSEAAVEKVTAARAALRQ